VDCVGGTALSKFKWNRTSETQIQMLYTCCAVEGGLMPSGSLSTTMRVGGDRESLTGRITQNGPVDCGNDSVIQYWHVTSEVDVEFRCGKPIAGQ